MRYDRAIRFLIRDGAGQFSASFDDVFRGDVAMIIRTLPRTPVANAYAERWVGTVRRELLDRTLIWNRPHLRPPVHVFGTHRILVSHQLQVRLDRRDESRCPSASDASRSFTVCADRRLVMRSSAARVRR
jgi:hypothetical protein